MTNIRKNYWIPGLRQLTKKVINMSHGCKRFQSKPYTTPIPGYLPKTRTEKNLSFKVIGADYAGPRSQKEKSRYAYCYLHIAFPEPFTNAKPLTAAEKWIN